ncbi:hypothetical protein LAZ67_7000471 [Cordylochernes scorpioides]|uniref:Reverse transcriptase Ty1/copia-type domain-containing protein n=1 Tax=Cordylochernes scorpioides TaxID=51811 RepID=A0ABY6KLX5_9ARAC|nr:hypothetical protein LAZ67_7000471 [Cordylochernes scorpioides]
MDWPAKSPDLNPIEHVWDALGRRIGARHPSPRTLVELKTALLEEWGLQPLDLLQSLVNSMRACCETLIAVRASNKKILTSKWLFKVKEDGRYKARLVVRGFKQEAGIDYDETFSPVISTVSLRIYFALMAKKKFAFKTFYIKTSFIYGFLDEEIYVQLPEGYKGNICRLRKALYGLKQAPLKWNERLKTFLKSQDFIQLKSEPCVLSF